MLQFGNKEFRNLQEQVFKNMKDIANMHETQIVLDEFGIKVIGEVASVDDMPTVEEYKATVPDWEYGDAYAVGTEPPYTLYILTRANENHDDDYWFNIGEFPAVGPEGPQGPQGSQGPQGQTGATGADGLSAGFGNISANASTLYPNQSATASVVASGPDTAKVLEFSFGIPQGIQGEQGEQGVQGETGLDALVMNNYLYDNLDPGERESYIYPPTYFNREPQTNESFAAYMKNTVTNDMFITICQVTNASTHRMSVTHSMKITGPQGPAGASDWGNISGNISNQTDLMNALNAKQDTLNASNKLSTDYISGLASVATTGAYSDLSGKPTIPTISGTDDGTNWTTITIDGTTKAIPSEFHPSVNDFTAGAGIVIDEDLSNDTIAIMVDQESIPFKVDLASVAFSGNYSDLNGTPSIPAAQVQSDYAQDNSSAVDYIKNKPDLSVYAETSDLANVATSGDYDDLTHKPIININDGMPSPFGEYEYVLRNDALGFGGQLFRRAKDDSNVSNWSAVADRSVLSNVAYSGNYSNLNGTPDLSVYAEKSELANVATSGSYDDLLDKPTIPVVPSNISAFTNDVGYITDAALANYAEKSELANVAFSGEYSDLMNTPTIPVVPTNISAFTNDVGYITDSALSGYAQTADLANIAFSGNYSDLVGAPVLANVATSGSYNDLTDKPTIPVVDYPVTDVKVDGVSVMNGSVAEITMPGTPSNMVTTNTSQTITGVKTIDADIQYTSPALSMRAIKNNGSGYGLNFQNNSSSNIISIYVNRPTLGTAELGITPRVANCDLGGSGTTSNYKWRNLYLSGNISDGTNNISVSQIVAKQNAINASNKLSTDYISGLANVATTGNYSDLLNVPTIPTVDQTYNASSANAQSGIAVAGAIAAQGYSTETWTFTLGNGSTITKNIVVG